MINLIWNYHIGGVIKANSRSKIDKLYTFNLCLFFIEFNQDVLEPHVTKDVSSIWNKFEKFAYLLYDKSHMPHSILLCYKVKEESMLNSIHFCRWFRLKVDFEHQIIKTGVIVNIFVQCILWPYILFCLICYQSFNFKYVAVYSLLLS